MLANCCRLPASSRAMTKCSHATGKPRSQANLFERVPPLAPALANARSVQRRGVQTDHIQRHSTGGPTPLGTIPAAHPAAKMAASRRRSGSAPRCSTRCWSTSTASSACSPKACCHRRWSMGTRDSCGPAAAPAPRAASCSTPTRPTSRARPTGAGGWWTTAPRRSGAGYALENRLVISRLYADLFRDLRVRRLAGFFATLRDSLAHWAPVDGGNAGAAPLTVLVTPGPHNETYFEHTYLARYLGIPLVEGNDLTVREDKVWLKTLTGMQRVHVILRRLDDDYCDPLELRIDVGLGFRASCMPPPRKCERQPWAPPVETARCSAFCPSLRAACWASR